MKADFKTEAHFEEWFKKECNKNKLYCWKMQSLTMNGIPDRLVVDRLGNQYWVELKNGNKYSVTPLQSKVHDILKNVKVIRNKEEALDLLAYIKRWEEHEW